MALLKPLPAEVLKLVEALVGCVAGAALAGDTERWARSRVDRHRARPKAEYVEAMTSLKTRSTNRSWRICRRGRSRAITL